MVFVCVYVVWGYGGEVGGVVCGVVLYPYSGCLVTLPLGS